MIGGGAVPAPCAGSSSASSSSPTSTDLALVGGPSLSASYHAALEASISHHFPGNAAINCMCHSTEDLLIFLGSAVARSSDDFWPRDPPSHRAHVAVNAYNSVFSLLWCLLPDWDMFHSRHPAARLHALARVVSGGPVYVSDAPGAHDAALLRRLVLPDGRVLRPVLPGRPTADSLFRDVMRDGESLLKVSTVNATAVALAAAAEEEEKTEGEEEEEAVAAAADAAAEKAEKKRAFSCGVVGVFNTQGAAWSRRTRRFELLKTENERNGSSGGAGCAPDSGVASWLKNRLLPLCGGRGGGGGGDEKKRTESEDDEAEAEAEVLSTTVSPSDVTPRLRTPPSGAFIAWSDEKQRATLLVAPPPRKRRSDEGAASSNGIGGESSLVVSLPRGGADLISFSPVLLLLEGKSAATLVRASVVGLTGMVNAGGAVLSVAPSASGSRSVSVALRGSGELTLWCEAAPASATVDGKNIERSSISWDAASKLARVQVPARVAAEEGGFEPDAEVVVFF